MSYNRLAKRKKILKSGMKKLLYVNLGVCEIQFLDVFLVFGFGFVNDILICIQEVYKSLLVIYTAV